MISRRSLITGLISFVAAPAIVRASNLMPVKVMEPEFFKSFDDWVKSNGWSTEPVFSGAWDWASVVDANEKIIKGIRLAHCHVYHQDNDGGTHFDWPIVNGRS
jgi:hypothetical protein